MPYTEELDSMTYSFSRLNCFDNCKYEFYLSYIEQRKDKKNSFYAQFGSLIHSILEQLLKNEITKSEAVSQYCKNFDDYTFEDVRSSTREKYYDVGLDYVTTLDLSWLEGFDILGVELRLSFPFSGHEFVGYIDLLVRDKETNSIVLIDHKSSDFPLKKNGEVKKAKEKDFFTHKKQLYLYCFGIQDKYGVFPEYIIWNHFKDKKWNPVKFNIDEYNQTLLWVDETIKALYKEDDYLPTQNFFYCNSLCNHRHTCEYLND